jgi:hypothetical protein
MASRGSKWKAVDSEVAFLRASLKSRTGFGAVALVKAAEKAGVLGNMRTVFDAVGFEKFLGNLRESIDQRSSTAGVCGR